MSWLDSVEAVNERWILRKDWLSNLTPDSGVALERALV